MKAPAARFLRCFRSDLTRTLPKLIKERVRSDLKRLKNRLLVLIYQRAHNTALALNMRPNTVTPHTHARAQNAQASLPVAPSKNIHTFHFTYAKFVSACVTCVCVCVRLGVHSVLKGLIWVPGGRSKKRKVNRIGGLSFRSADRTGGFFFCRNSLDCPRKDMATRRLAVAFLMLADN